MNKIDLAQTQMNGLFAERKLNDFKLFDQKKLLQYDGYGRNPTGHNKMFA